MSETNEAKEPGQTLFEASGLSVEWSDLFDIDKAEWAKNERVARDAFAPRLATLEAETRDLHRKLSESRVEAQAQRAGRVEAEHRLGLLVSDAGRRVLAIRSRKLVRRLRKRIAELEAFEGSQTDAAMKGAQDVAALAERAEKAERERDEAVAKAEDALRALEIVKQNRDEARDHRAKAWAERDAARGALDMLEHERNAARRERDEARAEVARLTAHLNPRPDAGLAGLAEREAVAEAKAERRPPFRDWTDEARAKLVPGASVMWHCLISACEPRTYGTPRRIVVREVCADDHPLSSGYVVIPDGPPDREVNLSGCDPATIEPPATQDEPVRPPAPDLRPGDEVTVVRPGFTRRGRGRVLDAPALFDGVWQVRCAEIDCEEPGRVSTMPVDWIDMASRVRPPQRQPAPDLRKGDTVAHLSGCNVRIEDAPYLGPGGVWWVRCSDAARPVSSLALYLRVRTWQPGEVVPHAPLTVMRDSSTGARAFTASGGINPNLPLAEPWTQTGI